MTDYEPVDKHWAKRYILDPLTAPEPSQETGPGSSHYNVRLRAAPPESPRRADSKKSASRHRVFAKRSPSASSDEQVQDPFKDNRASAQFYNNPTPPESTGQYHVSNPYSARRSRRSSNLDTHHKEANSRHTGLVSPPQSPESIASKSAIAAQPSSLSSTAAYHNGRLPIRSASARAPGPASRPHPEQHTRSRSDGHRHHPRPSRPPVSLVQRYPGDMSHRPLDMIKRETRAADRRHRKRFSEADTIDLLDTVGPTYHHGGPYDATLASRNMNKMYSPVEAVRDSNLAALRATPREFIQDALVHHRPLQGTATIPSGGFDASGNRLDYEEGADLMREPDAPGGAYRRYDFIDYHPNDLKGKGEPSYSIERHLKKDKGADDAIEMESNPLMAKSLRRKSVSGGTSSSAHTGAEEQSLGRQNSTGHRISEGLKRRFGSLRRKKSASPDRDS
ncbi:Pal1 cell morphology [Cordyceps militaris]|uniref:Pal1 cell morphology n=1 Tax=Cordyceps militaris TaxID=73501 RepID=A0A2H4SHN8_CORMI|nr:Pal1 cell morphology [Cordyceps militaris]